MSDKVGAVLVVGGGIGGIQSSLDLADSGFKVYLLDKSPAIGGVMVQLDKTFPTNDCAMCILAPKLVDAGRHQNIKIITQASIEKVEGEAGNFKVTVKKNPRYIIEDKCTGCAECAEVCPVERPSDYEEGLAQRKAIYRPYAQAIPNIFTISKNERPPCTTSCPVNTNAQGYIALIGQGKFREALNLIREKNPLPAICGRVCTHPCETACNRKDVDEPIAIRVLKRFVADYEANMGSEEVVPVERTRDEKVAIVGSGPAGLTAAYDLVKMGYGVTIFESLPVAGGMLAVGIPEYRLPKDALNKEIEAIQKLGVEIRLNTHIGKELTVDDLREQGYKAIFLAVGAHNSLKLNVPGEDLDGIYPGVSFLRDVNLGKGVRVGEKVAVIGGGNVAIDSARTALRLGAKEVFIVYRRSRQEMPATDEEVEMAEAEGVKIRFLAAPVRVLGEDGRVVGMKCIRMELGEPDASGRRRPLPIEGSEFTIEADMVIPAIGQAPDLSFFPEDKFQVSRRGTFEVDPISLATNIPGVFAGGDATSGPATVIEAMAAGRRASNSINRYLRGEDLRKDRESEFLTTTHAPLDIDITEVEKKPRQPVPTLTVEESISNFDEVELGFTEEMAIAEAERCLDCGICSECFECVRTCKAEAVDHLQKEEILELNVGSIILAPGFDEFEANLRSEYGYGRFPNVVTSIQFERILSASGPFQGKVQRPSDRKEPKKIAFVQCVGSRDPNRGSGYCSSVCCTYAIKEAIIAKEHAEGIEATIFFMDMRTHGKGFEGFYERAKDEYGVRFIRSRVPSVEEVPGNHNLVIKWETEDGRLKEEEYDMVVLSVGLVPSGEMGRLAERLGVEVNEYGFIKTDVFSPLATTREGIYVCGASSEPKDIPETVAQASAAASMACGLLSDVRHTETLKKTFPAERDVSEEDPRIGVFICNCGINIGGVVRVPQVVEYARGLPDVVYVEENLYTCSQDTQVNIKEKIEEHGLNRVVVASCTPRTHEPLFQDTLREAGLNPFLFEFVNIRDQCSWVHMHQPDEATEKAKELVTMGVAKARLLKPISVTTSPVNHSALVIGGGLSGLTAALSLADGDFDVHLVERESELGGNLRHIHYSLDDQDPQEMLRGLVEKAEGNGRIHIYKGTEIKEVTGYVGNFKTTIESAGEDGPVSHEIEHGAIIVATGAQEYRPTEYLYGQDDRVITQRELEERLGAGADLSDVNTVVMIQCVGSRNEEHPYCSRICCSQAVKNSLKLKESNPDAQVFVLYRDIRTYGFKEQYYRKAREAGVIFIRYDLGNEPAVDIEEGELRVLVKDPLLNERLLITPDLLVLSAGVIPRDNEQLSKILKVPLTQDKFFLEAHIKLRPLDFAGDGIFLCGLAHSPKLLEESIVQAHGAAGRAATLLSKDYIEAKGRIAVVNERLCSGCGICTQVCPYDAREIDEETRVSKAIEVLCQGCGACAIACPNGATQQRGFERQQALSMVDAAIGF